MGPQFVREGPMSALHVVTRKLARARFFQDAVVAAAQEASDREHARRAAELVRLGSGQREFTYEHEMRRWEQWAKRTRQAPDAIIHHLDMARALRDDPFAPAASDGFEETIYSSTATETALTAASEAAIFPVSTKWKYYGLIPGGYMRTTRTLHLRVAGQLSTAATPGTFLWAVRWGGAAGTVLVKSNGAGATGTAITMAASQTNVFWRAEFYVTARVGADSGATGSLFCTGILESEAIPTKNAVWFPLNTPAAVTVNNMHTTDADLTFTHTPSLTTASLAGMQYTLESMN